MVDYPIKFRPILQEKIWGGNKLRDILNKQTDKENVGESWEISGVKDFISEVSNGSEFFICFKPLPLAFLPPFVGPEDTEL